MANRHLGIKDITVTPHAKYRAYERLGVNSKDAIRRMVVAAKIKGTDINYITKDNYQEYGLTLEQFKYIKTLVHNKISTYKYYYHNGIIYVMRGYKSRTLITIMGLKDLRIERDKNA